MTDHHRLSAGQPGFEQATFVVADFFRPVHVAQVNFHAGDLLAEAAEGLAQFLGDVFDQGRAAADVVVGADFDLHGGFLSRQF